MCQYEVDDMAWKRYAWASTDFAKRSGVVDVVLSAFRSRVGRKSPVYPVNSQLLSSPSMASRSPSTFGPMKTSSVPFARNSSSSARPAT